MIQTILPSITAGYGSLSNDRNGAIFSARARTSRTDTKRDWSLIALEPSRL